MILIGTDLGVGTIGDGTIIGDGIDGDGEPLGAVGDIILTGTHTIGTVAFTLDGDGTIIALLTIEVDITDLIDITIVFTEGPTLIEATEQLQTQEEGILQVDEELLLQDAHLALIEEVIVVPMAIVETQEALGLREAQEQEVILQTDQIIVLTEVQEVLNPLGVLEVLEVVVDLQETQEDILLGDINLLEIQKVFNLQEDTVQIEAVLLLALEQQEAHQEVLEVITEVTPLLEAVTETTHLTDLLQETIRTEAHLAVEDIQLEVLQVTEVLQVEEVAEEEDNFNQLF